MAYRFTLAPVLKLRQSIEERDLHLLEQTQHEIAHTVQLLDTLNLQERAEITARERELASATPAVNLHFVEQLLEKLQDKKRSLEQRLAELQALRQQQLDIYEAAKRNRQVLSELRDRQREAYDVRAARELQKATDDIFLARRGKE
jgi:flagellar export protein FliJ